MGFMKHWWVDQSAADRGEPCAVTESVSDTDEASRAERVRRRERDEAPSSFVQVYERSQVYEAPPRAPALVVRATSTSNGHANGKVKP